jgi:hypothetical protein
VVRWWATRRRGGGAATNQVERLGKQLLGWVGAAVRVPLFPYSSPVRLSVTRLLSEKKGLRLALQPSPERKEKHD